jgi:4'-phosphopantetheinyl transferase
MALKPGEIQVWVARDLPSDQALGMVLAHYTAGDLEISRSPNGKPYLAGEIRLRFNLAHSGIVVLVAVALDVEVGVDVERLRPMPDCLAVAGRFFTPEDAAAIAEIPLAEREREFFRRWTRTEAMLKARGLGLYGAGTALDGDWTVEAIDAGDEYAAAVAAERSGMSVRVRRL